MASDVYYQLGAIKYGSVFLGQVSSAPISPNVSHVRNGSAGTLNNTFIAKLGEAPTIDFTTTDLKGAIDLTGTTGLELVTDPLELYYLKISDGGTYGTSTDHVKVTVNAGYLTPVNLTCDNVGVASMTMSLTVKADGTNNPLVYASDIAAPASSADADRLYTVDKLTVDTAEYEIDTFSLDFGINLIIKGQTGIGTPTFVGYDMQAPNITLASNDYAGLATIDPTGATKDDVLIYLARLENGGSRYADNTTSHIKVTVNQGHIRPTGVPGDRKQVGALPYTIESLYDGTNAIIAIDTASTIT